MRFTASELARDLGGELHGPDADVEGIGIDSRRIRPGQLFAAVRADRDGHDFVAAAVRAGAPACLVERPEPGISAVVVPDVERALLRIGRMSRRRLPDRVVGITGSVGKTTAKDLLAAVLARRFVTAASEGSFNNELGVPLTLANAADDAEVVVVEMGARGHGHIDVLCGVAQPTVGIELAVAPVHVEGMGGLDQITVAKRELVEALPADGLAVLNADDQRVLSMAGHTRARVLTFGDGGDVTASRVSIDDELFPTCTIVSPWGEAEVRLGIRGLHNVSNALAAAAAGFWLGVPLDAVVEGLAQPVLSALRMDLVRSRSGALVLNDAYNASPTSMAAALKALASLPADRHIAVLGYMAELGGDEREDHLRMSDLAQELGVEVLAVGTELYGCPPVPDPAAALAQLGDPGEGVAVLVKGSRVAGLERVAAGLISGDPVPEG